MANETTVQMADSHRTVQSSGGTMLRRHPCGIIFFCLLASFALHACRLTRLMEAKSQLCDERPPQVIVKREPGSGIRVVFETPTLTESDVIAIVGFKPTQTWGTEAVRELSYEALPLHQPRDRASSLVLRLAFTPTRGAYRLSEAEIPEKFNSILPAPLLDAAITVVCQPKLTILPPGCEFSLTSVDRATLPTLDQLRQVLGPPTAWRSRSNEISYEYCLAPCDLGSSQIAHLGFSFGDHGELQRAEVRYFRYSATVDLISSEPKAIIKLD
jgi:hypothetical protein